MRAFKVILIGIVLLIVGLAAYLYYNQKKALSLILPDVREISHVRLKLLKDSVHAGIDLVLHNKSVFKINIDSFYCSLSLDTALVVSEKKHLGLIMVPDEQKQIPLELMIASSRIKKLIHSLNEEDSLKINLHGKIRYSTIFGFTSLPFNEQLKIVAPIPPRLELIDLDLKTWSMQSLELVGKLNVINKGNLNLELTKVRYKIKVADLFEAEQQYPLNLHIEPKTNKQVLLPIELTFNKLFKTAWKVIRNKDRVPYHLTLTGFVKFDTLVEEPVPLEVVKHGMLELKK